MSLDKHFDAGKMEPQLREFWSKIGVYKFDLKSERPVFSIDTPPPTVSGHLHLGHVYSYSHTDINARYRRMRGNNVFYPMGFDDNGLPTERLVEKRLGITSRQIGRSAFVDQCLQISEEMEAEYKDIWQKLGLSIDWEYTYRTIEPRSQRIAQQSFVNLFRKGLAYQKEAPVIWCPECRTAISQADLSDQTRESEFVILEFHFADGASLPIATTRPELLPACVAVFVHPGHDRFKQLVGKVVKVPLLETYVPILSDPEVNPEKGTGVVMCCTFGDSTDIFWWQKYNLPFIEVIGRDGKLSDQADVYRGLLLSEARSKIIDDLTRMGYLLERRETTQAIHVHERCDTIVEYLMARQWFIRVLDGKQQFLEAGNAINWYPDYMQGRYSSWIENLSWDWCISRQRYFGVHFPLWYCRNCGEIKLADDSQLPVDPTLYVPEQPCLRCGGEKYDPETDIMDTWATSSLSPQIVGQWMDNSDLFKLVYPFSLRPQAHEIIRTWTFYTILQSLNQSGTLPWKDVVISGWGIAGEGQRKISKSRGGGVMLPAEAIGRYSADAVRYWAASTGLGKDAVISEEKMQTGYKLVTKLWNVARFSERFILGITSSLGDVDLSPADRWIISRLQRLIIHATEHMDGYDYASVKSELETFFWKELADNYLEMVKQRLYPMNGRSYAAARHTLSYVLITIIKLFAPFFPYVTETIYQGLFVGDEGVKSIHNSSWPEVEGKLVNSKAEETGMILVEVATAVRRYKSELSLPLGTVIKRLQLATVDSNLLSELRLAEDDLRSITRVEKIEYLKELAEENIFAHVPGSVKISFPDFLPAHK